VIPHIHRFIMGHVLYSRLCLVWRTVLSPYRSICSGNSRQSASRPGQTSALENGDWALILGNLWEVATAYSRAELFSLPDRYLFSLLSVICINPELPFLDACMDVMQNVCLLTPSRIPTLAGHQSPILVYDVNRHKYDTCRVGRLSCTYLYVLWLAPSQKLQVPAL
jgi:hypothetical protein